MHKAFFLQHFDCSLNGPNVYSKSPDTFLSSSLKVWSVWVKTQCTFKKVTDHVARSPAFLELWWVAFKPQTCVASRYVAVYVYVRTGTQVMMAMSFFIQLWDLLIYILTYDLFIPSFLPLFIPSFIHSSPSLPPFLLLLFLPCLLHSFFPPSLPSYLY